MARGWQGAMSYYVTRDTMAGNIKKTSAPYHTGWPEAEIFLRNEEFAVANTTKIEDKLERKKVKRTARKKAAPKAKRTTPRGSNKKKVKQLVRGQSKR